MGQGAGGRLGGASSISCARQRREEYGEKRSGVFYDIEARSSTVFKMLLTGSR